MVEKSRVSRKKDLIGPFEPKAGDELIICRCEEITRGEIRRAIHDGMYHITEIKRYLRAGMGLCQGQTCETLVKQIIAEELHCRAAEIESGVSRAPVRPVELEIYGKGGR
jgi:NAD(P)H-nitrite reductase large subunit